MFLSSYHSFNTVDSYDTHYRVLHKKSGWPDYLLFLKTLKVSNFAIVKSFTRT